MSLPKIVIGSRWECLTIISVEERIFSTKQYDQKRTAIVLRCDCGNEKVIWKDEWRGWKQAGYDCGCGVSLKDRARVMVSLMIPIWLKDRITGKSTNQRNMGKEMVRLIKIGIENDPLEKTNG
jgi:hypothetical protein